MSDAPEDQKKSAIGLLHQLSRYENSLFVTSTFSQKLREAISNLDNPYIENKEWLKKNALAEYFLYKESFFYQIASRVFPREYQQLIAALDELPEVVNLKKEFEQDRHKFIQHTSDSETDTGDSHVIPVRKGWLRSIDINIGKATSNLAPSSDYRDSIQSVDIQVNPLLELKEYYEQFKSQRIMAWLFPSVLSRALNELEAGIANGPEKLNKAYAEYFKNRRLLYLLSYFYPIEEMLRSIDSSYTTQEYRNIINDVSQSSADSSLARTSSGTSTPDTSLDVSSSQKITDRMALKYKLRKIVPDYKIEDVDNIPSSLVRLLVTKIDETEKALPSLWVNSTTSVPNGDQRTLIKKNERFIQILKCILEKQDENLAKIFFQLLLAKGGLIILVSDAYINLFSKLSTEETKKLIEDYGDKSEILKANVDKLLDESISPRFIKKEESKVDGKQTQIQAYLESKEKDEGTLGQFRRPHRHQANTSETTKMVRSPEIKALDALNRSLLEKINAIPDLQKIYNDLMLKGYISKPYNPIQLQNLLTLPATLRLMPINAEQLSDILNHLMSRDNELEAQLQAIVQKIENESQSIVVRTAQKAFQNVQGVQGMVGDTVGGVARRVSGLFMSTAGHLNDGSNHSNTSLTTEETSSDTASLSLEKSEGIPSPKQSKKRASMVESFLPFSFGISEEQIEQALQTTKMCALASEEPKHLPELAQQVFQLHENKRVIVHNILLNFPQFVSEEVFQWLLAFTPQKGMEYVKILKLIQEKGFLTEQYLREVLNSEDGIYSEMVQKINISKQLLAQLPKITSAIHHLPDGVRQDVNGMIRFLDKYQVLSLETLQALRLQLVLSGAELAQDVKNSMVILQEIQPRQKLNEDMVVEWLSLPSEALKFYSQNLPKMAHTKEALASLQQIYQLYRANPEILFIISARLPAILPLALNPQIHFLMRSDDNNQRLLTNEAVIQHAASLLRMKVDFIRYKEQLLGYSNLKNLVEAMESLEKLGINVSACFDTIIKSSDLDGFVAKAKNIAHALKQTEVDISKLDSTQLQNLVSMSSEELQAFVTTMPYLKRMDDHPLHLISEEYSLNWVNMSLFFQIMEATQIPDSSWADVLANSDLADQSTAVLENILQAMRHASQEKLNVLRESMDYLLPALSKHLLGTPEDINCYVVQVKRCLEDKKEVESLLEQHNISTEIKQKILQHGHDAPERWVELHTGLIFLAQFQLIEGNETQLDVMIEHLLHMSTEPFFKAKHQINKNPAVKACLEKLLKKSFSLPAAHCFGVLLELLSNTHDEAIKSKLINAMGDLLLRTPAQQEEIALSLRVMQFPCNQALLTADNLADVIRLSGEHVLFSDMDLPDLMNGKKALSEEDFQKIISTGNRELLGDIRMKFSEEGLVSRFNDMKKAVGTVSNALGTMVASGSGTAAGAAQYLAKNMSQFGLLGRKKLSSESSKPNAQLEESTQRRNDDNSPNA